MSKQAKTAPKDKKGGKLLSCLALLLILGGVLVIAYPFVLTQISQQQKDEVVRQLEAELPIFRDEADFIPIDIAAMPVVDTPQWTKEEIAQAGEPLGLIASMFGQDTLGSLEALIKPTPKPGQGETHALPSAAPGGIALPTLLPALQDGQPAATSAPQPTDRPEEGVEIIPENTPTPIHASISPGSTRAPQLAQGEIPLPITSYATPLSQTGDSPLIATTAMPIEGDKTLIAPTTGWQTQDSTSLLPSPALPQAAEGVVQGDTAPDIPLIPRFAVDPQIAQQALTAGRDALLREEAPVFFEDLVGIPQQALALGGKATAEAEGLTTTKQVPEDIRLTFQSIQGQLLSSQNLMQTLLSLPTAGEARALFQGVDGEHAVPLTEGVAQLEQGLSALAQAHLSLQALAAYPDALPAVQAGLDELVPLVDQLQNVMDYMAKYTGSADADLYARARASSQVGQTEAVYLLEIPAIDLKVGCFQDVGFDMMYKSMRKGAALFPRMGAPNTNTNITMAAHRTGSAAFFNRFDKVQPGDRVLMHTRTLGSFLYEVESVTIVENNDWTTTYATGYPALTMMSCEEYRGVSNGRRIVVRAKLISRAQR